MALNSMALKVPIVSATDLLQNQKGLHPDDVTMSVLVLVGMIEDLRMMTVGVLHTSYTSLYLS